MTLNVSILQENFYKNLRQNLTKTINDIKDNLAGLSESLIMYFYNLEHREHCWVQNPFKVTEKPLGFLSADFEKLIEIPSDTQLMANFEEMPFDVFWGYLLKEYPEISKQAIAIIMPFATTYSYESGISRYANIKLSVEAN